jgi:N-acetylglucosamine kinase-like BadF-type ATPase
MSFEKQRGRLEVVGRAGGWGWILGDEGGGFHVGREAVREVLRERDEGRGVTGLREAVLAWFGVSEVLEILPMVYMPDSDAGETGMSREKRLSSLAPVVFKAGFEAGDEAALAVLRRCSGLLVVQICVLLGEKVKADECALCLGGSLLGVGGYRDMVLAALRERGHVFKHVEYVEDAAAVGAVALCTQ